MRPALVVLALVAVAVFAESEFEDDMSSSFAKRSMRNALVRFGRSGMRNALVRFGKRSLSNDYAEAKRAQSAPEPFVRFGRSVPSSRFALYDYYDI
ncbi:unnamed protein product [Bursaphelenchus okinawaensis]|uniref:Uncharacterized protein n=1 Tax=Bursaphelenchus okinawaensis TaxID=465554 RepID=A0A811KLZ8_9BILA|nr:unnamed protein product [Bursaphelenchus okinawaensis]CAG9105797.1 unnamed protein product [Bursaphelenchus okinawaensis]